MGEKMKDINTLIEKIKKWLIAILIFSLLYPIIIHFLFKWKSGYYWIIAEWNCGDILGYGGAVLTAIGTSVLGLTTLIMQSRNEENNQLLQNRPQIEVSGVEVNKPVCCMSSPYNTTNLFPHALALKRPGFEFSGGLNYREFNIICKNIHGIEPCEVKVMPQHCNISFNNGRRRGRSLVKNITPFVEKSVITFENFKKLDVVSDDYINIQASDNLYFKFPVVVMYNENDTEFVEDVNDSIENNTYGLMFTLRFKNNLGYFEESNFSCSIDGDEIYFNKTNMHFGKEANFKGKKLRKEQENG